MKINYDTAEINLRLVLFFVFWEMVFMLVTFIYSVIDYTRQCQNFSYEFNDYEDPINFSQAIDEYIARENQDVLCEKVN